NGEEDLGLNVGGEEGHNEEEEEDELYKDVNINQERGIQENLQVEDSHVTLTPVNPDEQTVNEQLEAEVLTRSSYSSKTSYDLVTDLSDMELKKIFIEKYKAISLSKDLMNKGTFTRPLLKLTNPIRSF
nr:hypothetical protein [Tanacetum cinerariifolium]